VLRKSGAEPFHASGNNLGFDLQMFWQWAVSDLVSNTARGVLAEFLVARALGIEEHGVRDGWSPYDLKNLTGLKIEVKSAAYIQSWFQKEFSRIVFSVSKKRAWDSASNVLDTEPNRHADLYVFALLAHKDKATLDPMNVDQWVFYVLPTEVLNKRPRSQHSITLKSLEALCQPVRFPALASGIEAAGLRQPA